MNRHRNLAIAASLASLCIPAAMAQSPTGRLVHDTPEPQPWPGLRRGLLPPNDAGDPDLSAIEARVARHDRSPYSLEAQGKCIHGVIMDEFASPVPARPMTGKARRAAEKRERRLIREETSVPRAIRQLHEATRRLQRAQEALGPLGVGSAAWHALESIDDCVHNALAVLGD